MSAAPPLVRGSDPATSHAAARLTAGRITLKQMVRDILEAHPAGLTDHELWELTGLPGTEKQSVIKRRGDCLAVDSFIRRRSPKGNLCVVWILR